MNMCSSKLLASNIGEETSFFLSYFHIPKSKRFLKGQAFQFKALHFWLSSTP